MAEPASPVLPEAELLLVLLSPLLFLKLLIASAIVTVSVPVLRPSMVLIALPSLPFISRTSAVIVAVGLASFEFSPICEMAASTKPNLPASSLAATVVLRSVGMVVIKSISPKPKAVAVCVFLSAMLAAKPPALVAN